MNTIYSFRHATIHAHPETPEEYYMKDIGNALIVINSDMITVWDKIDGKYTNFSCKAIGYDAYHIDSDPDSIACNTFMIEKYGNPSTYNYSYFHENDMLPCIVEYNKIARYLYEKMEIFIMYKHIFKLEKTELFAWNMFMNPKIPIKTTKFILDSILDRIVFFGKVVMSLSKDKDTVINPVKYSMKLKTAQ